MGSQSGATTATTASAQARTLGRRARVRGLTKVAADVALLAAAINLARLSVLGLAPTGAGAWVPAVG
ncbi:MAG: hypothetical protein LC700_02660 [Actinobacteria bacterium]|nr:hypothetical protein [Actinomycetota bacterium]